MSANSMPGRARDLTLLRQPMPEDGARRAEQRHQHHHQQHGDKVPLDTPARYRPARNPMTTLGSAAMISTVGLMRGAESGVGELRGVERGQDGKRHREQHRVERALDGAEDERHQTKLGLDVVGGAGRLPDVLGPGVAFVPDFAEQRLPADLWMRVVEPIALQTAGVDVRRASALGVISTR